MFLPHIVKYFGLKSGDYFIKDIITHAQNVMYNGVLILLPQEM
jgi:hypothetical protein